MTTSACSSRSSSTAGRWRFEENLINGTNLRVSYEYNQAGKRERTTWPDSLFVFYVYDALNRMTHARENATTGNEIARYQYDSLSRCTELRFAARETNKMGYTYEPDGAFVTAGTGRGYFGAVLPVPAGVLNRAASSDPRVASPAL